MLPLLFSIAACATPIGAPSQEALSVSSDGRYLQQPNGSPFFWLGDTAWELFHRATREEAEEYLENRRRKGFTVIQAVILAELGGLRVPNANGQLPLIDKDPARPNEAYFRHVDEILGMAEKKGLYMALLPTWGDKFNKKWGEGPEIFTPDNARAFGAYLGRRYKGRKVVWVLGGDRDPETPAHRDIVRAMAEGIDSETGGSQLITYHPQGGSKSWTWFSREAWLDFHLFQSGHGKRDFPNDQFTDEGLAQQPPKPVIDGEPRYEDHPVDWKPELGWFDAFDVRQAAWWSVLSGAAGHTYGNHNVWQMWAHGREPISSARTPWKEAMDQPGAAQMGHLRRLLETHGFGRLAPAQHLLANTGSGAGRQRAAMTGGGRTILVYSPLGEAVRFASSRRHRRAFWFDPRDGKRAAIPISQRRNAVSFDPPGEPGRGNDWVLVLDSRP